MADNHREPPSAQEHRGAARPQVQEVDEMTVMWDVQERNCAVCGRIFIPQAPKAKYCSEDCRRKHEQDRAKEARRKGTKPKRDSVDRYLAPTGPAHDEIMAMRREVAMRY
ncbi:hypothetical protein [Collinsella aerofaciens]|uniref:hypothetical protein n=1 Tax=Collinsella aerofaciens TaxID=74426 RepID=UPI0022E4D45C|nr:hypothetical protein [Collinsella aerofaciens]